MRVALRLDPKVKFCPAWRKRKKSSKQFCWNCSIAILAEMEGGRPKPLAWKPKAVSSITTDQGILHYEVYGRGKPVILLHGWLGSWGLWQETMTFLGQYYRTYALDFWGFGESGTKAQHLSGAGFCRYGGPIYGKAGDLSALRWWGTAWAERSACRWRMQYPERVRRKWSSLVRRLTGSSLALPLKLAGTRRIAFTVVQSFWPFRAAMRVASPFICRDPRFPDMMDRDLSKTNLEFFLVSIATLRRTDLRPELRRS